MKNIEQYKRRFNMLIESSMGDVKPLINEQTTNELIGKTVNFYTDETMKDFKVNSKIDALKKMSFGVQISTNEEPNKYQYFECKDPNKIVQFSWGTGYNKQFTDKLNQIFCQTGQGGANVPKADMASNNSTSSGQEPQSV
jgi:hypothetical protein